MRSRPITAYPIVIFMTHKWKYGEWEEYGAYLHVDDVCTFCGCARRTVLTDEGIEWCEFYELRHNISRIAPECIPDSKPLCIIADPTDRAGYFKEIMKKKHGFIIDLLESTKELAPQELIQFVNTKTQKEGIIRPPAKYNNSGYLSLLDKYAPENST